VLRSGQSEEAVSVVVVFGGPSPEHEVSLASARGVVEHAQELGWHILPTGVGRDGSWHLGPGALHRLWEQADRSLVPGAEAFRIVSGPVASYPGFPPAEAFGSSSMALPVAHGHWGEDGTLQRILLSGGFGLIGCGPQASSDCMDKARAKSLLARAGLPVTRGVLLSRTCFEEPRGSSGVLDSVGPPPWFVKPQSGGSSLGTSQVRTMNELPSALRKALLYGDGVLVEEAVPHRELVVGIVGRSSLLISPPGECRADGDLYTYEEKYTLGNPLFTCPADIGDRGAEVRELAEAAYRALDCDVYARVDLFLDQRSDTLMVNEVNTIPGMTSSSVFPKVMRAAGLDYPDLLHAMRTAACEGVRDAATWPGRRPPGHPRPCP
jgi:D-alanine-D-alanine ligase